MNFKEKLSHQINLRYNGNAATFIKEFLDTYTELKEDTVKSWVYRATIPKAQTAILLADFFDCDFEYLFGEQTELRKVDVTITERLGLSEESIINIGKLKDEEKKILDLMFHDLDWRETQQILDIIYRSGVYLANGQNKIHITVDVLPDTNPEIIKAIHDNLKKDVEKKLLKLQAETAFYKLFDDIVANKYFRDTCENYLFNLIDIENQNLEYIRNQATNKVPSIPPTD